MKLVIKEGPDAGRELDVEEVLVVGRDPESASLVLGDPEASRRHASVSPGASGVAVEDLGSTNGTFVNGERIDGSVDAGAGDEIRIGTTVLVVQAAVEVTRMSEIPEPVDAGATAFDEPVPEPPAPEPPSYDEPTAPPPLPPAPGGPPEAAPSEALPGTPPPPPPGDFASSPPPPPGGAQGFGAPPQQQAYQQPAPPMGQPGGPMVPGGYTAASPLKTRESVVEWLLCAFVPFYSLFWIHRASKEMQSWSGGRIDYSAGATISALTIGAMILVPPFVAIFSFGGRVRRAQELAGIQPTASGIGFFGRLLLLGYGYKWMQDQLNEIAVRQPQG
jgi:pSer/pThr/pTyr-binding forkhead associated (FHA) protein